MPSADSEPALDEFTRVRDTPPTHSTSLSTVPTLQGYVLDREIARGGMGAVYAARDTALDREVAVKVMLPGKSSAEFVREARIAGRLPHPGIPPIHALGELPDGRPFLAMKLIRGDTLDRLLRARTDAATDRSTLLASFEQVCLAVGFAHSQGIVHRDLKPSNIMVGAFGEVQVMDWGLAKVVGVADPEATVADGGSDSLFSADVVATVAGQVKGTPAYMAPEQARGEPVDACADVFALGGILAAILTGRAPFGGTTVLATIIRAAKADLTEVFGRLDACGADVELVELAKWCLAAKAAHRPANGEQVAAAVAAYRAGVDARLRQAEQDRAAAEAKAEEEQNTRREAEAKTAERRKRLRAQRVLAAAVLLLTIAGTAAATVFALRAESARQEEQQHAVAEADAKREAQRAHREAQRQLVELNGTSGLTAEHNGDHALALLWFARAIQLAHDEPDLQDLNRIRMTNYLRQVWLPQARFTAPSFQATQTRFQTLQCSPDGAYVLAVTGDGECAVWDGRAGQASAPPVYTAKNVAAAWDPKGGMLAIADREGRIRLHSAPTFRPVEELTAAAGVSVLGFSRDGKYLAWGGSAGARVWNRETREYVGPVLEHPRPVVTLSFSDSGQLLATSALDGKARVFQVGPGEPNLVFPPVSHNRPEHGLAHGGPVPVAPRFAADDKVLLTVSPVTTHSHRLDWHDTRTGALLKTIQPPVGQGFLTAFAVAPAGDRVAVFWEEKGQLWDARTRQFISSVELGKNLAWCEDVTFMPDGQTLVTAAHNSGVQFWSVTEQAGGLAVATAPPLRQPNKPVRVTCSAVGGRVATALWDGTVSLWRAPAGPPVAYKLPTGGPSLPVLSPNGSYVLPGGTTYRNGTERTTRVYQVDSGEPAGPVLDPGGILLGATFSPDGALVATTNSTALTPGERDKNGRIFMPDGKGGTVQIWDWRTGKRLTEPVATPGEPRGLAFRPDGSMLAAVCADYRVVLIDPRAGTITRILDPGIRTRPFTANLYWGNGEARFRPDGRFLVTWELAKPVHVWDPDTGHLLHTLPHNERVEAVAFHPTDPTILATAGRDSTVYVWNIQTGAAIARLQHPSNVSRVRFSPDESELITVGGDGMLRVWDWRGGILRDGINLSNGAGMDFTLSADGNWLVTLGLKGLQLVDWRTRKPVSPTWPVGVHPRLALRVSADGRRIFVGSFSSTMDVCDLTAMTTPANQDADALERLAELAAGRRILESGRVVSLDSSEWGDRWSHLDRTAVPGPK